MSKTSRIKKRPHWVVAGLIACMMICGVALGGDEFTEPVSKTWIGVGGMMKPVYPGSKEYIVSYIPYVEAEFSTRYFEFFAGWENGIGGRFKVPTGGCLSFSAAVNPLGLVRDPALKDFHDILLDGNNIDNFMVGDSDSLKSLLEDTPKVESDLELIAKIVWESSFCQVSSTVTFLPIDADYEDPGVPDRKYDGVTVSLDIEREIELSPRTVLNAGVGGTWMNDGYAEALHGVLYPTQRLKRFDAGRGISDVHMDLALVSFMTEHTGVLIYGGVSRLLGDAARSPITTRCFQGQLCLMLFYAF